MNRTFHTYIFAYVVALLATSCNLFTACHNSHRSDDTIFGDTLTMKYAQYLTLIEHDTYTEVQIHSPWNQGKRLQMFKLAHTDNDVVTPNAPDMQTAFSHALFFTAAHSAIVAELGCIDNIAGICESEYVAHPHLRQALDGGFIMDMGSAMTPDRERIANLSPDVILLSPYENASTYGNLEGMGIPIIQCADYMETSALGRAEWLRLYGRLFGKAREADSLFLAIESQYLELQALTAELPASQRPSVLFDTRGGSAWYVPGGRSTIARLVNDAGGTYIFADNTKSGSVPLSFESVLSRGETADFWLIRYNNSRSRITLHDLATMHQPYTLFQPYRKNNVYGCNSAELIFHEESPFHPERVLKDFILILHPELLPNDTIRYFHKL